MGLLSRRASRAAPTQKTEKEIPIVNRLGLHARPAAMFVRIASRYRSEVWVSKEGEEVNGKSIMGLMMLAAGQGSKLRIRFEGAGVSPGIARGKVHVVRDDLDEVVHYRIAPSQVTDEISRFETALIQT